MKNKLSDLDLDYLNKTNLSDLKARLVNSELEYKKRFKNSNKIARLYYLNLIRNLKTFIKIKENDKSK